MKRLVPSFVLLAAAVVLGALGQVPLAALSLVAAIGYAAVSTMSRTKTTHADPVIDDLHPSDQSRLGPIRRHRNAIRDLVEEKKGDPAIAVVGAEALGEADRIVAQAVKMLKLRRELLKASAGRTEAGQDLAGLDAEIAQAASEEERESLRAAQAARRQELAHYEGADAAKERIETGLRQAEAALAELKARLTTAAAGTDDSTETDELRETVGRLKSLGASLDEAEAWLKG